MNKHELNLIFNIYSEQTLDENSHLFTELDWISISLYQNLTESFIQKHKDKLHWPCISSNQCLSDNFIQENYVKLYPDLLLLNFWVSESIKNDIKLLKEII